MNKMQAPEGDDDNLMDHVAMEAMHAIDKKDKGAFLDALHVLVAHTLSQMQMDEPEGEQ